LGDDLGGLVVIADGILELLLLFGSLGIKVVDVLLDSLDLLGLGVDDSGEDGSLGVELSLELGLKLDSEGLSLSNLLVELADVLIA